MERQEYHAEQEEVIRHAKCECLVLSRFFLSAMLCVQQKKGGVFDSQL
jgi:hypothetical protein